MYCECHKINPNSDGSYIDSPERKKNKKKQQILSVKKIFQYTVTVTLNYKETKKDPQRVTKIKPFINKYNWEGINFPSEKDDWKKIEKN